MDISSIGTPWMWGCFIAFVLAMLALDLGVFHRKGHAVSLKEALVWSFIWIGMAGVFNLGIYHFYGDQKGLEFTTGYLIEKALSVDNIFVFLIIFAYFAVPAAYQHRVLFWGIVGALIMRAIFIFAGAALLTKFHWIIYVFGGFLIITGIKMLIANSANKRPDETPVYRFFKRLIPSTNEYHGQKFFVRQNGILLATPLFLVLLLVEFTDLIFAVDSIPAIFAITQDPFIVFTSNIFAILGLRSLFFLLAGVMDKFYLLKPALALVLIFVGTKMAIMDIYKIQTGLSLLVVGSLIAGGVTASLIWPKKRELIEKSTPAAAEIPTLD